MLGKGVYMHHDSQMSLLVTRKKNMVVELLDQLCRQLEITDAQYQTAKSRYEAVGSWLSESVSPHLSQAQIYPQGSIALGTTIKPMGGNEFDVDLVCHLPTLPSTTGARPVKELIGARLKENATYRGMLEEKQRCWRINYANEFHLDITPSISNPGCYQGGELVPDKKLSQWKPTNPKGYIGKFDQYAAISPLFDLAGVSLAKARADVTPLPDQTMSKPLLKRIVQLLKRHRDQMFVGTDFSDLAPISVIITTLAGWSYARCASQRIHTGAFDFITAVVREMSAFIQTEVRFGRQYFVIENETTAGENFAEKWNSDERLAAAFFKWHKDVLASLESLLLVEGADQYAESLSCRFGAKKEHVREALAAITTPIGQARSAGLLAVAPSVGLISSPMPGSVAVPKNTFFGR